MLFLIAAFFTFFGMFIVVPMVLGILRFFGIYTIVSERECQVFILFGKVVGMLDEPGLHFLPSIIGPAAFIVNFLGSTTTIDLRLDQVYQRSQPVNSEEGTPMGIGVWYEMVVSDPIAYLFRNADPRGSLRANVSNSTVRALSNMKLADLLESRHFMSKAVRDEVTPVSHEWGYKLGTVYIRKVHFRDIQMIKQIEAKVVNRLRQVTASIQQHGANQVSIISSNAERQAATEFAKAAAMRPFIVGTALNEISQDSEVADVMFAILENEKMLEGNVDITLIPEGMRQDLLTQLQASQDSPPGVTAHPTPPPVPS